MSRIIHTVCVLSLICSQSALAKSGLGAADESTINGTWESVDFGAGLYYRLDISWPGVSLIVMAGTPQSTECRFTAERCTIIGGDLKCVVEDQNTGIPMRISGHVVADSMSGRAVLSLHAMQGKENRLVNEWDEPSRTFWKESFGSRLADLVKAAEKAAKLAHGKDGGQLRFPKATGKPAQ